MLLHEFFLSCCCMKFDQCIQKHDVLVEAVQFPESGKIPLSPKLNLNAQTNIRLGISNLDGIRNSN